MTTETLHRPIGAEKAAVAARLKELKRDEAAAEREARRLKDAELAQRAQRDVAREHLEADKAARKAAGEAAVAALRSSEPYAEVHSCEKVVRIDLASGETVSRSTAVEALRRAAFMASEAHRDRVVRSRQAGSPQPAKDWTGAAAESSGGLLPGIQRGVLSIRPEDH